jgi:dihydrofolate reductase
LLFLQPEQAKRLSSGSPGLAYFFCIAGRKTKTQIIMRRIISFAHISLDGFVAGPNGEMDWIKINDEIFAHVEQRIGQTDTAMYGRKTYDMMESYWPTAADQPNATRHDKVHSGWYRKSNKIVLSQSMKGEARPNTTIISDNFAEHIRSIREQPGTEILLFGSPSATHALMEHGLIDGYWLFVNPVVLGTGIPLFDGHQSKTKLDLLSTRKFNCGVTELNYVVGDSR